MALHIVNLAFGKVVHPVVYATVTMIIFTLVEIVYFFTDLITIPIWPTSIGNS